MRRPSRGATKHGHVPATRQGPATRHEGLKFILYNLDRRSKSFFIFLKDSNIRLLSQTAQPCGTAGAGYDFSACVAGLLNPVPTPCQPRFTLMLKARARGCLLQGSRSLLWRKKLLKLGYVLQRSVSKLQSHAKAHLVVGRDCRRLAFWRNALAAFRRPKVEERSRRASRDRRYNSPATLLTQV